MRASSPNAGFTLVEILIVIALIGIVAMVTVPMLGSLSPAKVDAAASEVGTTLRFAVSEAQRSGSYLLVDASTPGQLRLHTADASGAIVTAVNDPVRKTAFHIDTSAAPWGYGVTLDAQFLQGGSAYRQLLISPSGQLQVLDAGTMRGPLEPGSALVVASGTASATVKIDENTGRVTIP